jgi:hypothetical protein
MCGQKVRAQCVGTICGHKMWVQDVGTRRGHNVWAQYVGTRRGHKMWAQCVGTICGHSADMLDAKQVDQVALNMKAQRFSETSETTGRQMLTSVSLEAS